MAAKLSLKGCEAFLRVCKVFFAFAGSKHISFSHFHVRNKYASHHQSRPWHFGWYDYIQVLSFWRYFRSQEVINSCLRLSLSLSPSLRNSVRTFPMHLLLWVLLTTYMSIVIVLVVCIPAKIVFVALNFNCYRTRSMYSRQNSFCWGANSLFPPN